jgi:hypothetical protein
MTTISQLKKHKTDLGRVAAHLPFEGSLLCSETYVHVYPENKPSFSVKWADGWHVGGNGYFYETGTDHEKTAQAILEKIDEIKKLAEQYEVNQ